MKRDPAHGRIDARAGSVKLSMAKYHTGERWQVQCPMFEGCNAAHMAPTPIGQRDHSPDAALVPAVSPRDALATTRRAPAAAAAVSRLRVPSSRSAGISRDCFRHPARLEAHRQVRRLMDESAVGRIGPPVTKPFASHASTATGSAPSARRLANFSSDRGCSDDLMIRTTKQRHLLATDGARRAGEQDHIAHSHCSSRCGQAEGLETSAHPFGGSASRM